MPGVSPQLYYEDPAAAIDWLCRVFGFTERSRLSGPNGEVFFAVLRCAEDGNVMISGLPTLRTQWRAAFGDELRDVDSLWPNPFYSLTVMVPDVDAHFARTQQEGARVLAEPTDQPWGYRDYEVLDLEGRQWNFSQHLHDVAPEDWGATSSS